MPTLTIHGIEIAYETSGPENGRPLVLIMGLATSLAAWPPEFCTLLAKAGHYVVCFDNRDCGLSTKFEATGIPDLNALMAEAEAGRTVQVPYTLSDMAADTIGVMDRLGLAHAHICGVSMGGMIGQVMALEHPERMASLISCMSTTGEPDLPTSSPAAQQAMQGVPPDTREAFQDYLVEIVKAFSNDSDQLDTALQRRIADRIFTRGFYPEGYFRHMAAIIASGGRRQQLKSVRTPTLVLHGDHDALLPPAHGRDTAASIPGARFELVPGLGHALAYPALWPQLVAAISAHTAAAGGPAVKLPH